MAGLSGFVVLLSGGAIVTMLSPRLPRRCQRRETTHAGLTSSAVVPANAGTTRGKLAGTSRIELALTELNSTIVDLLSMNVRLDRMARFSQEKIAKFIRAITARQVRLACGLVLFAYLVSHFLNHALGNISMDALAAGVYYHTEFWQFLPVAFAFYTAALVHAGLGIWALYERRQFRWKAVEPLQLVLGLSIPALIITHLAGVRIGQALFGHEKLYPQVLYAYWVVWPYKMWLMLAVMTVAWTHGCIGLYFWLRMKAFYKRAAPFLLAAAVLIPTLAMLGLYQGGRSVVGDSASAEWKADNLSQRQVGTPAEQAVLDLSLIHISEP